METRKITIANTRDQKKSVVMTAATTLGELKRDLDAQGINYCDMDFIEALTKTQLRSDDSVLPHDVPYNHTITNELVFLLTVPNRKIKSGIDRTDVYDRINAYIDSDDLKEAIKERFGRNYTMVATLDLQEFINEWDGDEEENDNENENESDSCTCIGCRIKALERKVMCLEEKIDSLVEAMMFNIDALDNKGVDASNIYNALGASCKPKDSTVYSAGMSSDEIDQLVSSVD